MLRGVQHVRAGYDSLDEKGAEQNRGRDTARDAKGHGGDQVAATGRVVGSAWAENSFDGPLAETLFVRGALNRVRVCHPLCRTTSHARKYADIGPERAAFENQPPVAKGIFHALHYAAEFFDLFP